MFQVGDKVLYPMYGAGIIDSIVEKEVLGANGRYYRLNIPHVHMEILIPIGKAEDLGIRQVVDCEVIDDVLRFFYQGDTDPVMFESNNRFYRDINKKKIKSGDIYQESEIIRDLTRKSKLHKLGTEDNNMLHTAFQLVTSEIVQVKGIEIEKAAEMLQEVIDNAKEEKEAQEALS